MGYWYRTTGSGVSNISLVLIDDSEYANFQSGASFSYYSFWSRINTNSVWFPTQTMTSVGTPRRFIVFGVNFAATTVVGMSNFINGACVPSSTCVNGGICNTGLTCDCPPEWTGTDCATPVCSSVTCNSHQMCSAPNVCTCQAGWSGSTCNVPICTPACVVGQGTCTSSSTCTCAAGFSGATCAGVNGGYTSFGPLGPCTYDGVASCSATQYRTCTSPAPSHGGLDCSTLGASSQSSACTCPPIDGGYTGWADSIGYGCVSSPTSSSGCAIMQQRICTDPTPQFGGRNCSSLGAAQRSLPCACRPAGVDSDGSSGASSLTGITLPSPCDGLTTIAVDELTGIVYAGCAGGGMLAISSTSSSRMVLTADQCGGGSPHIITVAEDSSVLVACSQPGPLLQLDVEGQARVLVEQSFSCDAFYGIAIDPSSSTLYVTCVGGGVVSVSGSAATRVPSACTHATDSYVANGILYVGCFSVTTPIGLTAVNITTGSVQAVSSEQFCSYFHSDGAGNIYALCGLVILQIRGLVSYNRYPTERHRLLSEKHRCQPHHWRALCVLPERGRALAPKQWAHHRARFNGSRVCNGHGQRMHTAWSSELERSRRHSLRYVQRLAGGHQQHAASRHAYRGGRRYHNQPQRLHVDFHVDSNRCRWRCWPSSPGRRWCHRRPLLHAYTKSTQDLLVCCASPAYLSHDDRNAHLFRPQSSTCHHACSRG